MSIESGSALSTTGGALAPRTLVHHFRRQVALQPSAPALHAHVDGAWRATTWREFGDLARALAAHLVGEGVPEQGHVAIWAGNRPEWHIASAAVLTCRARPVPVYLTLSAEQAAYVLGHSESRVAIVEGRTQLERIRLMRDRLPALVRVLVLDPAAVVPDDCDDLVVSWDEALRRGRELVAGAGDEVERRAASVTPDDVATLVYTSGTTGPPKAVMATHRNIVAAADALGPLIPARPDDRVLSYLPLAHIVERLNSEFRQYVFGNAVWFSASMVAVAGHLREVRPTFFFGVPRVWEKMVDHVRQEIDRSPALRRWLAHRAIAAGSEVVDRRQRGEPIGALRCLRHRAADRLVLSRIREAIGLDRAGMIVSGAAPIAVDVLRFLHALGLDVCEGYGMTESMASTSMNRRGQVRLGTVGPAVPGVEVRIAEDGEILVRGDVVFAGYHRDPQATAEAIVDGWLHTGDIGTIEADGHLRITDRKKDLLITAGGKNISPSNIETELQAHPLIGTAVVIGDRRPYLVALLTLDAAAATGFAAHHGITTAGAELAAHPAVQAAVRRHVDEVNARLANVETVKRWTVLPRELTVGEELTPTYKVRRRVVAERYAAEIEALYPPGRAEAG